MNKVEAAAMWMEANVSFKQAQIILRHLYTKFGVKVQVPFSQIQMLGDITRKIMPKFGEFIYKKSNEKENEKVGEKIEYWEYSATDLLEIDFSRYLKSLDNKKPVFGYKCPAIF